MRNIIKKHKFIFLSIILESLLIFFVSLANLFEGIIYAFFYNLIYGLVLSVIFPLYYAHSHNEDLKSLGITKPHLRQYIVILSFTAFSISGQLFPFLFAGEKIEFHLLRICIIPLIMTTFFEELIFRGFLQTRLEKQYGWIAAVLLSGLMFSLYHIGYPGFRNLPDLLLLFAVGTGFALAYKSADNHLIAAYFVNLPNAFITYLIKTEQFPTFTESTPVFAGITIIFTGIAVKQFTN